MSAVPDELTGTEQAVLLVLMAESRPVTNPELERLGPKLDKAGRDRLNRLNLIETTPARPMVHELTDEGWALCRKLFGADVPARPSSQGKALYTVLKALGRYFERADLVPSDVFLPSTGPAALSADIGDLATQVRRAYHALAARPGGWVELARLREALPGVEHRTLDGELVRLYQTSGVSLIPEENQKTLTDLDRAAAVRIGNQDKHLIAIES